MGVIGGATWDRAGESFYYTTVDDAWRSDKVWRHRLGTTQADDELVHHETDERFFVGVGRSRSDRFLVVACGSKTTTEYRFLDADAPDEGFRVFAERREGLEYSLDHGVLGGEDVFLVTHNATGPDFELGTAPVAPTPPEEWRALVAHDPAVRLDNVDAFAGHLVVNQRSAGLTQLRILELGPDPAAPVTDDYLVEFDHEIYTVGSGSNPGFDRPTVRLGYTTMAVPSSVYDYDVRSRELTLLKQAPVLGGYDPGDYEEHRLWATAEDGERVPISIVARRDARASGGPAPRAALRLRRLRVLHRPLLLGRPPVPARPRGGVRHRARPRRRRDGETLVRRRQDARQAAHVLRLRRLRAAPRRDRLGHARRRWSPRAPAPAVCWSAPWPTRRPTCSAGSSPACRSWTP